MRSLLIPLVASAVAMAAVSCSPSAPGPASGLSQVSTRPNARTLAKAGLQYYWEMGRRELTLQEGESVRVVYKLDENLYAITTQDRLICVDAARGLTKWTYAIRADGEEIFHPSHADKATLALHPPTTTQIADKLSYDRVTIRPVVINTPSHVLLLDRDTGDLYRDILLHFTANTGTATDGVYAYVGTSAGNYCSILLDEAAPNWTLGTNSLLNVAPAVAGGRVYVGGTDGVVRCAFTSRESRPDWTRTLGGPVNGPLTVSEKACLVPCDDYRLYAFVPLTGLPLWKQPFITKGELHDPAQMGPSTIFQYSRGDKFYAINLVSGQERWESATAQAVLALMENNAYILDNANNLQVADEILGAVKQKLPLSGFGLYVANTTTPAIYVGNHRGYLACIRLLSAGYIKPSDLPTTPTK